MFEIFLEVLKEKTQSEDCGNVREMKCSNNCATEPWAMRNHSSKIKTLQQLQIKTLQSYTKHLVANKLLQCLPLAN